MLFAGRALRLHASHEASCVVPRLGARRAVNVDAGNCPWRGNWALAAATDGPPGELGRFCFAGVQAGERRGHMASDQANKAGDRLGSVSGFPPIAKVFLRGTKLTRFPPPEEGAPCHRTTRALGGNFTKPQLLRPTLNRWNRAFRPRGERLISDSTIDKWIMEARPKKDMLSTMRSLA